MLALLGSIVGLLGSLAPRVIGYFEQKQNHVQELEMLRTQGDFQLQLIQAGHAAKWARSTRTPTSRANWRLLLRP
ncbi:MAG: hypothetical protein K2Y40_17720 [Reyranella sp.]|jgi:hypothetical protein|nr:hypothetical protein [Reyranella sp.]